MTAPIRSALCQSALWTSDEIVAATGGVASAPFAVHGVAFDSREVGEGDLFIAMRGENTDGNRFVDQAFASGASGAIVEAPVPHPHVLVADATAALNALGQASRARSKATIVGVTGSVGKTGTKEAIAAALDRHAPGTVHRSVKSYNNHTGVPLSLARMPREARYGVFEMGMNHAGEISALTAQVRPHIALITAIAPAHIENLGSMEAIADAKAEIFEGLETGGTAIIPFDTPYRDQLIAEAQAQGKAVVTFGTGEGAEVRARDWVANDENGGSLISAELGDTRLCFGLAQPGDHWVGNAMAVIATARSAQVGLAAAAMALGELPGIAGRGARHHIAIDGGEVLLIDESYNANPASMGATLAQLGREPAKRRIAVLGAMKELGIDSPAYHAALADPLIAANVDHAILVGDDMAALADALAGRMSFAHGNSVDAALTELRAQLRDGDAVLVKGSNSVGLSRIVTVLTGGGA
jgi:UDP-N-acetylmuramoyl-tripeptide--D-alanyl-D-alanine ligase